MPDESGAGATDIARREIAQRMNQLKEQLLALEPQCDDRPRGDVYAEAMGGKEEVGHPVHHSVPQKTQHIGMASHVGSVTRKGLDKWCDEEPRRPEFQRFPPDMPRQERQLFHRQIHHEFRHLQGFLALEWDSARPGTAVVALKLQQASMRVEAISDGVRRYWAAVILEVVSANQIYQSAGPLARHSVQPDKRVMRGCEGRIHHLDRTQTETSRCGPYNRPPSWTSDRTAQSPSDWRFNLEHMMQLRMSFPRPSVQRRALVGVVAIDVCGTASGAISFLFVSSSTPFDWHSFSATSDDHVGINYLIGAASECPVLELNRGPRVTVATPFEKNAVRPGCDVDLDVPAREKDCSSHKEIERLQNWTTLHLFGWPVEPLSCCSSGHSLYVLPSSKLCDPKQCPQCADAHICPFGIPVSD